MTIIVDITVRADAFELGRILESLPQAEVELERIVPLQDTVIPLFWVANADPEEVLAVLESSELTKIARQLTSDGNRTLYEIQWQSGINGLVGALIETEAKMLEGSSTGEGWDFRLQFRDRGRLGTFRELAEDAEIPIILRRIYNPNFPRDNDALSTAQTEAIVHAYEHGYFEVPRTTTVTELAAQFGISDNAYSQRLRRGISSLIDETMIRR